MPPIGYIKEDLYLKLRTLPACPSGAQTGPIFPYGIHIEAPYCYHIMPLKLLADHIDEGKLNRLALNLH